MSALSEARGSRRAKFCPVAMMALLLLAVIPLSATAQTISVTRDLPNFTRPNEIVTVTLTQSGFLLGIGIVWETLPGGFTYVPGSYTGTGSAIWDSGTLTLQLDFEGETVVSYQAQASSYEQTAANFSGTWRTLDPQFNLTEGTVSGDQTVNVDGTAPVITNVTSTEVTQTIATITWDTDELADSRVKYGTMPGGPYTETYDGTDVRSHVVGLTGLTPNMTYYYVVNSTDSSDNSAESAEFNFTTLGGICFTIEFVTNYNMISMPLSDPLVINASSLIARIGANCTELVKWNSTTQEYESHVAGVPVKNFPIAGGEGYFVNLKNPTVTVFAGESWPSPFTISLPSAYSAIGLPVNDTSVTNASTLAAKIGANCTELVKWNSATQEYESHVVGVPVKNFAIVGGEGYFVNLNNATDVTFVGAPWHD